MSLPKDTYQMNAENSIPSGWRILMKNIEESLDSIEHGIEGAEDEPCNDARATDFKGGTKD